MADLFQTFSEVLNELVEDIDISKPSYQCMCNQLYPAITNQIIQML